MSKFKTSEHICSWAGLSPSNNESVEKKSTRLTKGNTYIKKRILCEVAWSITSMRDSYLATWYWKVRQRRGGKEAIVVLARKLLVTILCLKIILIAMKEILKKVWFGSNSIPSKNSII